MSDLLLKLAKEHREEAKRARELAASLALERDKAVLLRMAEQQDVSAAQLEAKAKVFEPGP
jgi:hypothetical protein